jgi:hypothetical protein
MLQSSHSFIRVAKSGVALKFRRAFYRELIGGTFSGRTLLSKTGSESVFWTD